MASQGTCDLEGILSLSWTLGSPCRLPRKWCWVTSLLYNTKLGALWRAVGSTGRNATCGRESRLFMLTAPPQQTTHLGGQFADTVPLNIIGLCVLPLVIQIKHPHCPLPEASTHPAPSHCHWLAVVSPFSNMLFWSETRDESKDLPDSSQTLCLMCSLNFFFFILLCKFPTAMSPIAHIFPI